MKIKSLASWLVLSFTTYTLSAQNEVDALRYSTLQWGGTARALSMGSAFGTLGADFSALSINPAGIGLYKSSELTITPSVFYGKTSSSFTSGAFEDIKYNFNLQNAGIVFAFRPKNESSVWKGVQFGMGINRLNNFNRRLIIEGPNSNNSLIDEYLAKAEGVRPENLGPFDTELAFNTYLIDTTGSLTNYFSMIPRGGVLQNKIIDQSGSVNEFVLTLGGNYGDKLYIGGTIGFPYVRFFENSTYTETDTQDTIPDFKNFTLNEDIETRGSGFNVKFGIIYRITDWVRFGVSVHTPTFYSLQDKWSRTMSASYDNGNKYRDESPNGSFDYELTTPLRASGGLAFVIGQLALITGEYEFVDYSDARLRSRQYKYFDENNAISSQYTAQHNFRGGAELRLSPISLRAGYKYSTSPYRSNLNDGSSSAITAGIGFREKSYFIDFAYVHQIKEEDYYLYPSVGKPALIDYTGNHFALTMGIKF
jgi:hypothetical protein